MVSKGLRPWLHDTLLSAIHTANSDRVPIAKGRPLQILAYRDDDSALLVSDSAHHVAAHVDMACVHALEQGSGRKYTSLKLARIVPMQCALQIQAGASGLELRLHIKAAKFLDQQSALVLGKPVDINRVDAIVSALRAPFFKTIHPQRDVARVSPSVEAENAQAAGERLPPPKSEPPPARPIHPGWKMLGPHYNAFDEQAVRAERELRRHWRLREIPWVVVTMTSEADVQARPRVHGTAVSPGAGASRKRGSPEPLAAGKRTKVGHESAEEPADLDIGLLHSSPGSVEAAMQVPASREAKIHAVLALLGLHVPWHTVESLCRYRSGADLFRAYKQAFLERVV